MVIKNTYYKLPVHARHFQPYTYPGADTGSGHDPIIADFKLNIKVISKRRRLIKYDIQRLNQASNKEDMRVELDKLCSENDPRSKCEPDDIWNDIRENVQNAC
ncbi:hypothetical protein HUJ05_006734 [Dendroctonus ponderosae]|nr:hypothetical protein HUJ05_006734 [Dendroctonus ponderosae]